MSDKKIQLFVEHCYLTESAYKALVHAFPNTHLGKYPTLSIQGSVIDGSVKKPIIRSLTFDEEERLMKEIDA